MKNKILWIGLSLLLLAGCATSTTYINYTAQRFVPKDKFYIVNVYAESQKPPAGRPYYVIGKVSIEGFANDGVSPGGLTTQAQEIARKRGADAIINAKTEVFYYYGGVALLRFQGDLIVYATGVTR